MLIVVVTDRSICHDYTRRCRNKAAPLFFARYYPQLLEFADALVERAAAKARAEIERQSDVEYIPKKEAIDLLGVCDATLWHWARSGYLVPVKLGRRVFYRRTDIQRLLNLSVMPGSDRAFLAHSVIL